jgi:hypothetical protein
VTKTNAEDNDSAHKEKNSAKRNKATADIAFGADFPDVVNAEFVVGNEGGTPKDDRTHTEQNCGRWWAGLARSYWPARWLAT